MNEITLFIEVIVFVYIPSNCFSQFIFMVKPDDQPCGSNTCI